MQTDTECLGSDNSNVTDQPLMGDDDPLQPATADDKIIHNGISTPQHKLCSNNLDDISVNTKSANSPLPTSSSFQERKTLFIEQARRFVKYI